MAMRVARRGRLGIGACVALCGTLLVSGGVDGAASGGAGVAQPFERFELAQPSFAWPGNPAVVKYSNTIKPRRDAIKEAISAWNHGGIDLRFKPSSRSQADIVIKSENDWPCGNGFTTYFTSNGRPVPPTEVLIGTGDQFGPDSDSPKDCRFTDVLVTAHELGHAIGLGHEDDKCAVMNSLNVSQIDPGPAPNGASPSMCEGQGQGVWYCRVLSADDLKGADKIYGGRPKPKPAPAFCPTDEDLR